MGFGATSPIETPPGFWMFLVPEDNDKAITPSIRVKVQPKTFDEKVAQKVPSPGTS